MANCPHRRTLARLICRGANRRLRAPHVSLVGHCPLRNINCGDLSARDWRPAIRNNSQVPEESRRKRRFEDGKALANTKANDQTSLDELDNTPQNARARQCHIILPKCMQTTSIWPF